jgi:hypothetical protein
MSKSNPKDSTITTLKDTFGNTISTGSIVLYTDANRKFHVGIFIRRHGKRRASTVAIPKPYVRWSSKESKNVRYAEYTMRQVAGDLLKVEHPLYMIGNKAVRKALAMIDDLKRDKKLPEDFNEKLAWGLEE